ncbi:hypothetical protein [uncultured Dokdonia sp.]|uniref:hypothetical protein n=1 Tax=uncultured Dokdonia sp. TaxID=575653 RepID=UPI00262EF183|nr:hypothetical protein [uncultured Dokdonia sp.]
MNTSTSWQHTTYTVYGITLLFFVLSLWGITHHELWLDEAHHYLLARDSSSIKDLIFNTQYEGHPITWNLILYGVTRITTDPFWMQVLHISIMTLTVGIFLKKAPFSLLFKLLFIFGYFMFYEYNILSRNYSIGILFIFLGCSLYEKREAKFIAIATLLGLASNSHAIFLILASAIMAMITLERLISPKKRTSVETWIGIAVFGIFLLISIFQILPPSDTSFFDQGERMGFLEKIPKSMSPFFKGIFIVPDVTTTSFWNSHMLVNYSKPIAGVFALASLTLPYLLFYKNRKLVRYMYFGIIVTGAFFYITALNAARYYGILYLFLITALWFDRYTSSNTSIYAFAKPSKAAIYAEHNRSITAKKIRIPFENIVDKLKPRIIYAILGLHFVIGIFAFTMDMITPFTTAKQTTQYLKDNHLIEKTIATKACNGTALSAYIEKPVFFTKTNSFESYCTFNRPAIKRNQGNDVLLKSINHLLKTERSPVIFVTHEPFFDATQNKVWKVPNQKLEVTFLKQFDGSIVNKGNHYIYEISSY